MRAGVASTTRPTPKPQTWVGPTISDLKPMEIATSTSPTKIKKRLSRSLRALTVGNARASAGGVFTTETILQPHDVVDLGRGDLEDVAVLDRDHPVARARRNVDRLAWM